MKMRLPLIFAMTSKFIMTQTHWDALYEKLYDAYEECSKNCDETYRQKIGIILDHMIENKKWVIRTP